MKESREQDIIRIMAKALMQYSISAFFLKEVSDMDVYEKLEELQEKAGDQTELVFYKKIIWY